MTSPDPEVAPKGAPVTPDRILDAVLALLARRRLRDLTVEDVAVRARVSRQTVYRHFGSRDGLVRAVVLREEQRLSESARAAVADIETLDRAVKVATAELLHNVRAHPLLDRLLADDPETLLPYLALGRGPVLGTAGTIVAELVERFLPGRPELVDEVAEVLSRLLISYTIAPGDRTPEHVGRVAARIVRGGLVDDHGHV